jgi:hypothetical protein
LTALARLKRVGREMKLVVRNGDDQSAPDPGLLRIIAGATVSKRGSSRTPN